MNIICIESLKGLAIKTLEPKTLGIEYANYNQVPKAIAIAQDHGVENLLFSDIDYEKQPAAIKWEIYKWKKAEIEYLAIGNSSRPQNWDWKNLQENIVKFIRISACDFSDDKKSVLTNAFINSIAGKGLLELSISDSVISGIQKNAFIGLVKLRRLSLIGNALTKFDGSEFGMTMADLWSLDLSDNLIKTFGGVVIVQLPLLSHLNLNNNPLKTLGDNFFRLLPNLHSFQLANKEDSVKLDCNQICKILDNSYGLLHFDQASCVIKNGGSNFVHHVYEEAVETFCAQENAMI